MSPDEIRKAIEVVAKQTEGLPAKEKADMVQYAQGAIAKIQPAEVKPEAPAKTDAVKPDAGKPGATPATPGADKAVPPATTADKPGVQTPGADKAGAQTPPAKTGTSGSGTPNFGQKQPGYGSVKMNAPTGVNMPASGSGTQDKPPASGTQPQQKVAERRQVYRRS